MKWFKHMSDMSIDVKIKRLIRKFGVEGYGLYNYILETIVRRMDSENPVPELEAGAEDIAHELKMDTVRVEEIMLFCLHQELFDQSEVNGRIVANKIYKFLSSDQTRNPEIKKMIASYAGKHEVSMNVQDIPDQSRLDEITLDETKLEYKSVDKPKSDKHKLPTGEVVPINLTTHTSLLETYGQDTVDKYYTKIYNYTQSHGKTYKDFAATARNWITGDIEKGNPPPKKKAVHYAETCPACGGPLGPISCGKCGLDVAYKDDEEQVEFYRQRMANRD